MNLRKVGLDGHMPDVKGQYYHIYNRGCNRQSIFCNAENYDYLLRQANKFLTKSGVSFIAYCLMPNHYHFLLTSKQDGAIARFIQRLFNSYTQAFNRQMKRSGTLFEGRAKTIWIDDEKYLLHLCRYIHLNPVLAGLVMKPEEWLFSNYRDWIGLRESTLIDREFVSCYFRDCVDYASFVNGYTDQALATRLARYGCD